MKQKTIVIALAVAGALLLAQRSFAANAKANIKDTTNDGTAGVSPINSKRVAVSARKPMPFEGTGKAPPRPIVNPTKKTPTGSAQFQNPLNPLAPRKYATSITSARNAPLRPDYTVGAIKLP